MTQVENRQKLSPIIFSKDEEGVDTSPILEVAEIIALPSFDPCTVKNLVDPDTIELEEDVENQLRDYVTGTTKRLST
jgi:hypothetical protein